MLNIQSGHDGFVLCTMFAVCVKVDSSAMMVWHEDDTHAEMAMFVLLVDPSAYALYLLDEGGVRLAVHGAG